jgi:hypothetical protein
VVYSKDIPTIEMMNVLLQEISILKEVLETVKLTKLEKECNELESEPIVYSPK